MHEEATLLHHSRHTSPYWDSCITHGIPHSSHHILSTFPNAITTPFWHIHDKWHCLCSHRIPLLPPILMQCRAWNILVANIQQLNMA